VLGRKVGHYQILRRVGEGGMGEVYQAEDLKLRRPVALKLLPEAFTHDPVARERLLREARAASRLSHQNIATIYEVGEHAGRLFLAMEYVDGEPLSRRIRAGPLPANEVIRLGAQVADALHEAHAHGVVHRDVKPGNIMVRRDGAVKVVDFGLALRTDAPAAKSTKEVTSTVAVRLTHEGHAAGTVSYMCPEQAHDGIMDSRGDIFSLGVVLYEAATGHVPFTGKNPLAIAAAIMSEEPVLPRKLVPTLPTALQEIVLHCLAKDPTARPQTAALVRDALVAAGEGVSTLTVRRVLGNRSPRIGLILGTTGAALGALALAAVVDWLQEPSRPRIENVEARWCYEQGLAYEDRGYTRRYLEMAQTQYEEALKLEPDNPWIQAQLANLLSRLALQYPSPERIRRAQELADVVLERHDDIAAAWLARARLALIHDDPAAAAQSAQAAKRIAPKDHDAYVLRGLALLGRGRAEDGMKELRQGMEVGREGHIWAGSALARALYDQGRVDEAAVEYEKVLKIARDFPQALNNLAAIRLAQGREEESIPLLELSLNLQHDEIAAANLGTAYYYLGRPEEAISAYKIAVEEAPDFPSYKRNLAEAYEKLGNKDKANEWYEKAIGDCDRALAGDAWKVEFAIDRAFCRAKLGRLDEARREIAEALVRAPQNMYLLYAAAQVHALAGDPEQAYGLVRRAVAAGYPRKEFRRDASFQAFHGDPEFLAILTASSPGR
jgi:tetratricopeptide (TPR) repeat protein/tRNA A-37 threonylcarbamoyl transferase component Bud32